MLSGMISPASSIPAARPLPRPAWPRGRTGARAFWAAQGLGWSAYFMLHYAGAVLDNDFAPWWASFASAVAGFVLTSAMRPALNRVWHRGPPVQVLAALGLALVFSVPYSAVSEQAYWIGQGYGWRPNSFTDYLGSAFWCGSILLFRAAVLPRGAGTAAACGAGARPGEGGEAPGASRAPESPFPVQYAQRHLDTRHGA